MESVVQIYNSIGMYIVGALAIIILILLIILLSNMKAISKLENKYRKLTRGVENANIEQLISSYMDKIDYVKTETEDIKTKIDYINEQVGKCIQNVSITRYKAFDDVGSDLSFSLAMLDENKDGVIITSIYGRNESTTYAKPIDKGISRYDLSEEEKSVLHDALNK